MLSSLSSLPSSGCTCRPFRQAAAFPSHAARAAFPRHPTTTRRAAAASDVEEEFDVKGNMDVSASVVSPVFRSQPGEEEQQGGAAGGRRVVRLLFISESNICRSVLAEAWCLKLLREAGLQGLVECESKATQAYCLGDGPDEHAVHAAQRLGLQLPEGHAARKLDPGPDVSAFDLLVVVDRFAAEDVLREVSVFDTVSSASKYTRKVRRLGEWHPTLSTKAAGVGSDKGEGQDVGDPLYGNAGGAEQQAAVDAAAEVIGDAVGGLVSWLAGLQLKAVEAAADGEYLEEGQQGEGGGGGAGGGLRGEVRTALQGMKDLEWLAPPMLSGRKS